MKLEGITLTEISQTEKDKYYIVITYIWNPNKKFNSEKWRIEWWLPGLGVRGNREMLVKGYKFKVCMMNRF